MDKKRKEIIENNEVSELYTFNLGGYPQKVLIEGKKKDLPIVITLHGGPGSPIPFSVGCRGLFPEFTDEYIMVYWDQLGCGINNQDIDDSFTIESFVKMTLDLINEVKALFSDNRIYIFSMSWGSILSAKILEKSPNVVDGIVAWGQIVKNIFFNEEVIRALEKSQISRKKLEMIKTVKAETATPKELRLVSISIKKFTSGYQNKKGQRAPIGKIIKGMLTSPDYKFQDFKAMVINGYRKNHSLWKEILTLDLAETLDDVKIPYIILQGDTDIVASTRNVQLLVGLSDNDNLICKIVKNSGHMPGVEGMNRLFDVMQELTK